MTPLHSSRITFDGLPNVPEVTWAGPNPLGNGLCVGFHDGTLLLADEDSTEPRRRLVSQAGEAINGVAGIAPGWLGVSTRSDVTIVNVKDWSTFTFKGGAHGVVATRNGCFVAALGNNGLLATKPGVGGQQRIQVTTGTEGQLYFYRVIALNDDMGKESLVFANRRNGVGVSGFVAGRLSGNTHTMTFDGLDVVDVCGVEQGSLSAIAISPKGEILWIPDTSKHDDPVTIRLNGMRGVVYRIVATPKHLLVLTSQALYIWKNFVCRLRDVKTPASAVNPVVLPIEAVDMTLIDCDRVAVVMATNEILELAITDFEHQRTGPGRGRGVPSASKEMSRQAHVEEDFRPRSQWKHQNVAVTMA